MSLPWRIRTSISVSNYLEQRMHSLQKAIKTEILLVAQLSELTKLGENWVCHREVPNWIKIKQLNSSTLTIKRYNYSDKWRKRDRKKFPNDCWILMWVGKTSIAIIHVSLETDSIFQFTKKLLDPIVISKWCWFHSSTSFDTKRNFHPFYIMAKMKWSNIKNGIGYSIFQKAKENETI